MPTPTSAAATCAAMSFSSDALDQQFGAAAHHRQLHPCGTGERSHDGAERTDTEAAARNEHAKVGVDAVTRRCCERDALERRPHGDTGDRDALGGDPVIHEIATRALARNRERVDAVLGPTCVRDVIGHDAHDRHAEAPTASSSTENDQR